MPGGACHDGGMSTSVGVIFTPTREPEALRDFVVEAERLGLPSERLAAVWEELIEQSIAYEFGRWDDQRG